MRLMQRLRDYRAYRKDVRHTRREYRDMKEASRVSADTERHRSGSTPMGGGHGGGGLGGGGM